MATVSVVAMGPRVDHRSDVGDPPTLVEAIAAVRAEGLTSDPTAVSWSRDRIDVFARGPDNALWHKWYSGSWSGWESLGGSLASGPDVASWGSGRLDVFARGTDNTLQHKWYDGQWSAWESLGGGLTSDPSAVSWAAGRLDVFARGQDNGLWHIWYANSWSGWESLGGTLASAPDASSWGLGRLDVFGRGTDNKLIHRSYDGQWSGWETLDGGLSSDPSAVSWSSGRIDVFARGLDNALWHKWYSTSWSAWEKLGGVLASGPDASSWGPGRLDVFGLGTDNALYHLWYGGAWSAWEGLGAPATTTTILSGTLSTPTAVAPSGFVARHVGGGSVALQWQPVAGAVQYRIEGTGVPSGGQLVSTLATTITSVPGGPGTWRVTSVYPNNFSDSNVFSVASAMVRYLPPRSQPWLTMNNGAGSDAIAYAHARKLCQDRPLGPQCYNGLTSSSNYIWDTNIGNILTTYDVKSDFGTGSPPGEVSYTNVTELGLVRSTGCFEAIGRDDLYMICYTSRGVDMDLIIKGSRGTSRFAALGPTSWVDWKLRWSLMQARDFDSEGFKYTPHVCLSCHGGVYDPNTGIVQGGTLLPIDPGLVQLADRPAAEEPIRRINELILRSVPPPAVTAYIQGMYGGRAIMPGATAALNYVPSGWATDANFYLGIVKRDCQMCHLAVQSGMDFLSVGNFLQFKDLIYNSVCRAKSMPHAEVPFKRFWTEDTGPIYVPGLLAARLGFSSCP